MTYLDQLLGDIKQKIQKNILLRKSKSTVEDEEIDITATDDTEKNGYSRTI